MSAEDIAELVRLSPQELSSLTSWLRDSMNAVKVELTASGDHLLVVLPETHAHTLATDHRNA